MLEDISRRVVKCLVRIKSPQMALYSTKIKEGKMKRVRNPKIYKSYRKSFIVGPLTLTFIMMALSVSLILLYLVQSSRLAVKGYDIAKLENQRILAEMENEKLEMQAASLKSIIEIGSSEVLTNLERVTKINYIPYSSTVAIR